MHRIDTTPTSRRSLLRGSALAALVAALPVRGRAQAPKRLAYLAPGLDLPFWRFVLKGVTDQVKASGLQVTAYDSHNSAQTQLQNAQDVISRGATGIVLSPVDSSTAPAVLAMAARASIPVVIADIGTTGGDYVSFITSETRKAPMRPGRRWPSRSRQRAGAAAHTAWLPSRWPARTASSAPPGFAAPCRRSA